MEPFKEKNLSVHLSPLQMKDADGVFQLWSDKEAVRLTNWPYFASFDDSLARLEKCLKYYENPMHFGAYAIRTSNGEFVGIAGADVVDEATGTYDVWYFLNRKFWGQGIAKKTVHELLNVMKDSERAKIATATAVTENIASWKILEHHNFKRTAMIPGGHTKHDQKLDLFKYTLEL
jgi:[ribosomal protein S5]-alanine N-acetyltransferase